MSMANSWGSRECLSESVVQFVSGQGNLHALIYTKRFENACVSCMTSLIKWGRFKSEDGPIAGMVISQRRDEATRIDRVTFCKLVKLGQKAYIHVVLRCHSRPWKAVE